MRMSFLPRLRDARYRRSRRSESLFPESRSFDEDDDDRATAAGPDTVPDATQGWSASSLELRHGLDVSDVALDTLPDDLISGFNKR